MAREHWSVFLEGHHEPYISKNVWEQNLVKLANNTHMSQSMNSHSPQNGNGLMVGLLRCRRCGHKLHAAYNIRTASGTTWTAEAVASFRTQHRIPEFTREAKEQNGWMTQAEAATWRGLSPMSMTRLVQAGIIPAEQPQKGMPTIIRQADRFNETSTMCRRRNKTVGKPTAISRPEPAKTL